MSKRIIISSLSLLFLFTFSVFAQQKTGTIKGKITDADTKEPLVGANVILESTISGTATDIEGEYSILQIPSGVYRIKISYIGYDSKILEAFEVKSDSILYLDINLNSKFDKIIPIVISDEPLLGKYPTKNSTQDMLDYFSLTPEDAWKNINKGNISIYLGGWLYVSDSLRTLSNKYGFEPAITGCNPINTSKYDSVMIDYLKIRNGENWYEEFLSEWDELKKYEQEHFKEIIEEVKSKSDR